MPDNKEIQKDYAKYRIERSKEDLDAAHLLFNSGNYRIANNRAYYSIFHALRAVLTFDNFDSSKHSGVIAEFRRRYIKEGIFPAEVSKMIVLRLPSVMRLIMMICLLRAEQILRSSLRMRIIFTDLLNSMWIIK